MKLITKTALLLLALFCTCALADTQSGMATPKPEIQSEQMKHKLLDAFGGAHVLHDLNQFSAHLAVIRDSQEQQVRYVFYDFRNSSIYQRYENGREISLSEQGAFEQEKGIRQALDEGEQSRLLEEMQLNFFYHLRNPDLVLLGPLQVPEHPQESWWRLQTGQITSPPGRTGQNIRTNPKSAVHQRCVCRGAELPKHRRRDCLAAHLCLVHTGTARAAGSVQ